MTSVRFPTPGLKASARLLIGAAAGLAMILATGPASAGTSEWKGEAAGYWVVRANNMARVFQKNINDAPVTDAEKYANKDALVANLASSCDGLQGEQMKNEYGKEPRWALGAQIDICSAYQRWAGQSFMTSKVPCDTATRGLKLLQEAKAGDEPPEVMAAVNALIPTVQSLLDAAKSKNQNLNLRCHY